MGNSIIEAQETFKEEKRKIKAKLWDRISFPPIKRINLLEPSLRHMELIYHKHSLRYRFFDWLINILYKLRGENKNAIQYNPKLIAKFINVGKSLEVEK